MTYLVCWCLVLPPEYALTLRQAIGHAVMRPWLTSLCVCP